MKSDVFITDGHWRKSLAAVRGLGTKGINVTVGESTRLATAMFSKYCKKTVVYPSPTDDPSKFLNCLQGLLVRHQYRMVLPMEDDTLLLLSEYKSAFANKTYIPVVTPDKLRFMRDKSKILKLAGELGIPTPRTWFINDITQLDDLKDSLPYPLVIKPRDSSGAVGVSYPNNTSEFMQLFKKTHARFPFPLIQERIPKEGPGLGASFLFDEKGQVKASFVHKRLREYPISGGASTLRESIKNDPIRDMGKALLEKMDWFGVAMVEFKFDPRDGVPKLMEINPRFWGSLALAIEAGVNFPYLLYKMSCGEKFKPVETYEIGKRCRWLLPGDILHYLSNPRRRKTCKDFFNFWDSNTAYDIVSLRDPLPVLGRILTPLTFLYDKDMKRRMALRK